MSTKDRRAARRRGATRKGQDTRSRPRLKRKLLAFLIDPAQIVRLVRITEALKKRHPGLEITRPDAARAAVRAGIEELERELRISEPRASSARVSG